MKPSKHYSLFCDLFGVEPTCEDCSAYSSIGDNMKECKICDGSSHFEERYERITIENEIYE